MKGSSFESPLQWKGGCRSDGGREDSPVRLALQRSTHPSAHGAARPLSLRDRRRCATAVACLLSRRLLPIPDSLQVALSIVRRDGRLMSQLQLNLVHFPTVLLKKSHYLNLE